MITNEWRWISSHASCMTILHTEKQSGGSSNLWRISRWCSWQMASNKKMTVGVAAQTEAFKHRSRYTQMGSHTAAFTQMRGYTKTRFTQRSFSTEDSWVITTEWGLLSKHSSAGAFGEKNAYLSNHSYTCMTSPTHLKLRQTDAASGNNTLPANGFFFSTAHYAEQSLQSAKDLRTQVDQV